METSRLKLSVVIVAWNGAESLQLCLSSLADQLNPQDCEVIVASNFPINDLNGLAQPVPRFKTVCLAGKTSVPELRAAAVELAKGEIVAFLEDHCRCDDQWAAEIVKGHQAGYRIVGGAVENLWGQQRLNWAVYFYDYYGYMLPDVPRTVSNLSGINVSYNRDVLKLVRSHCAKGFYETFVNRELQKQGHALWFMPSAIVFHDKCYSLICAVVESYKYGRDFAVLRVTNVPALQRLGYAGFSFLLPAVLVIRIVINTIRKRRHLGKLAGCFPHLVLLLIAWSYGELRGYLGPADAERS